MCGVEVWDYPVTALYDMMNAKFDHDWQQTASLMALVHNRTNWGKGKPKSAVDFMPKSTGKKSNRVRVTPQNIMEAFD